MLGKRSYQEELEGVVEKVVTEDVQPSKAVDMYTFDKAVRLRDLDKGARGKDAPATSLRTKFADKPAKKQKTRDENEIKVTAIAPASSSQGKNPEEE